MTGNGHSLLGKKAFESLPGWEQALIQLEMNSQALSRPYLPAGIRTVGEKVAAMCSILDWVYYEECRPYATLPDGRWIPHSPPDENMQSCSGSGQRRSHTAMSQLLSSLFSQMVEAIKKKDWEETIRWGGALGHFLQEPFSPGHAMDNNLFHLLFPDPDPNRHLRLHHAFDAAIGDFEPLPARLLGTSIAEAVFRLQVEIDRGIVEGMKLVGRVIQSVYQGKPDHYRQKLLSGQCQRATFVTASAWHTAFCIAFSRFSPEEVEGLKNLSLTALVPYFWHHCQYVDLLPGFLVKEGRKIPIHVWAEDGREIEVRDGFGMGGHMAAKFFVNGDVYPKFSCQVGLASRHREGQTPNTRTSFFVEMDEEENLIYSEDMEYHARRLARVELVPGQPLQKVEVDLRGGRTLILSCLSQPYRTPDGQVKFDLPHVAVCQPRLSKI
ncbi:MAG TPA: hypothetical protein PKX93_09265 [bacterium]|nr:hypothetical protein [bacterium]HPP12510.1 hypothetical protein [bacterium]